MVNVTVDVITKTLHQVLVYAFLFQNINIITLYDRGSWSVDFCVPYYMLQFLLSGTCSFRLTFPSSRPVSSRAIFLGGPASF